MAGVCVCGNEPSGSIKCGEILHSSEEGHVGLLVSHRSNSEVCQLIADSIKRAGKVSAKHTTLPVRLHGAVGQRPFFSAASVFQAEEKEILRVD